METLEVINNMLATAGIAPLSSLEDRHPLRPRAQVVLNNAMSVVQSRGWWFNEERAVLTPDASTGEVYLPNDISNVRFGTQRYAERGRRVYDTENGTYVIDASEGLYADFIRLIPLEDLPYTASWAINCKACMLFQREFDADNPRTQQYTGDFQQAMQQLYAEETRQRNLNVINQNPSTAQFLNDARQSRWYGTNGRLTTRTYQR